MQKSYPSNISQEQFEKIRPILESSKQKTKPRKLDLYDVFCGVLYVLKSGCQWRMLPKGFPRWESVYYYFRVWSKKNGEEPSLLELVLKKLVGEARISNGRKEKTSFCIIDSQSVKNADTAEKKGYDAGKKISGIKRHIAVDTQGLPHAIYVTTAEATDRSSAVKMVENAKANLSEVKNILVDAGYTGENFATQIKAIIGATVEVIKRSELHTFVVLPKRWVVERSFAWLEKCRRLWKNCERKLNTSLQMIVLSFISLLLRRF
ncbi:IS5 family transposase [Wolbachia endosymbiont of Cimex lectularius]|uniref:IS5 family transposase n=1 Tax=Wolbachia endosymbiont of Cimex lectularius TaxID=246273 RepID=UPI0011AE9058|nr:IS5 family transposase [Wolbachia endosymbiont of Cimex lectularius]